jgi:hypothetical protein
MPSAISKQRSIKRRAALRVAGGLVTFVVDLKMDERRRAYFGALPPVFNV